VAVALPNRPYRLVLLTETLVICVAEAFLRRKTVRLAREAAICVIRAVSPIPLASLPRETKETEIERLRALVFTVLAFGVAEAAARRIRDVDFLPEAEFIEAIKEDLVLVTVLIAFDPTTRTALAAFVLMRDFKIREAELKTTEEV
jgi:hypothetical protein